MANFCCPTPWQNGQWNAHNIRYRQLPTFDSITQQTASGR